MKTTLIGLTLVLVAACGPGGRAGMEASLKRQAAKDLNCTEVQMTLTPGPEMQAGTDVPSSEEAAGCGKKATYALKNGDWSMAPPDMK